MNPAGPLHDDYIAYLSAWSYNNTDQQKISVRSQTGLSLPELSSRPEPDVLWVKAKRYLDRHPRGTDVILAIEVSKSSLAVDRATKFELYASSQSRSAILAGFRLVHELISSLQETMQQRIAWCFTMLYRNYFRL